jgi:hypothetical protein
LFGGAFVSVFGMRRAFFVEIEGFRGVKVFWLLLFSLSKAFRAFEVFRVRGAGRGGGHGVRFRVGSGTQISFVGDDVPGNSALLAFTDALG